MKVLKKKKSKDADGPKASDKIEPARGKRKSGKEESSDKQPKLKKKKKSVEEEEEDDEEDGGSLVGSLAKLVRRLAPEAKGLEEGWVTRNEAARIEAATLADADSRSHEATSQQFVAQSVRPQDAPAEILDNDDTFFQKIKKKKRKQAKAKAAAEAAAELPKVRPPAGSSSSRDQGKKVWLGNLPKTLDEAVLRTDFSKFGVIEKCYFEKDEAGNCRGSAKLIYKDSKTVDKVLNLDNIAYKGISLRVKRRSPRRSGGKSAQRQRQAAEKWEAEAEGGEPAKEDAAPAASADVPAAAAKPRSKDHTKRKRF